MSVNEFVLDVAKTMNDNITANNLIALHHLDGKQFTVTSVDVEGAKGCFNDGKCQIPGSEPTTNLSSIVRNFTKTETIYKNAPSYICVQFSDGMFNLRKLCKLVQVCSHRDRLMYSYFIIENATTS